jgi:hypothetical protein
MRKGNRYIRKRRERERERERERDERNVIVMY